MSSLALSPRKLDWLSTWNDFPFTQTVLKESPLKLACWPISRHCANVSIFTGACSLLLTKTLRFFLLSRALHKNMITGSLPTEIGLLTSLSELYSLPFKLIFLFFPFFFRTSPSHSIASNIGFNFLSGTLPTEIGALSNLISLYVFLPSFPFFFWELTAVRRDLSDNSFSGEVPQLFGNLEQLEVL